MFKNFLNPKIYIYYHKTNKYKIKCYINMVNNYFKAKINFLFQTHD